MKTIMCLDQFTPIAAIQQFLDGPQAVAFNIAANKQERYRWVQQTLVKHQYILRNRSHQPLSHSGFRIQTKRLIRSMQTSAVTWQLACGNGFKRFYTHADIRLLASINERHGQPSDNVLKKSCEQAWQQFAQPQYQPLASICISH